MANHDERFETVGSESESEEIITHDNLRDVEQASEEEQDELAIESLGLNPESQRVIKQLLLKRLPRESTFQDFSCSRKKARRNVKNDKKNDDGPTSSLSTSQKRSTSRRNTGNPGSEVKKWTHDEILKLIDLYEENTCLWDIFEKEYHDKDKRERTLSEISRELDTPVADIKCKLLSLRSQLGRERAKLSKTRSGQSLDDLYKPTWIYWQRLQFLQAVMQPGKSRDNIQNQEDKEQSLSTEASLDSEPGSSISVVGEYNSSTPRATKKSLDSKKQELLTTCINVLKQPEPKPKEACSFFSLYISEKLSKFNARDRLIAEKRINDVIFDIEMKNQQQDLRNDFQPNESFSQNIPGYMQTNMASQRDGTSFMSFLQ